MDGHRIMAVLSMVLLLLAASAPMASARFSTPEGPNAGINPGETVFLGERSVNFSAFADPLKGNPVRIVRIDSGQQTDPIAITNNIANYIRGNPGQYYPVYGDGTVDQGRSCLIQDVAASLGQMMIRTSGTDIVPSPNPSRQGTIPYRMEIQFLLPDHNLPMSQFQGSWYEYELQGTVKTASIVNTAGNTVSLKDLSTNPATPDNNFVFLLSDQKAVSRNSQVTMIFRMTLNSLGYELPYTFTVQDYPLLLQLSESSVERGDDLILTVQGMPFMQYDINLPVPPAGENYPVFEGGGWDQKISDYHVRVHPEWDGTVRLSIRIPSDAPITSYTVSATGPGTVQPVTTMFYVDRRAITLIFDEPNRNQYAIGDVITLNGTLANIKSSDLAFIPIYLYVTGSNLPQNGAPLTDPTQAVVDGMPATFTVTYYNPVTGIWEYQWDTALFFCDEGTYTVHANLQPIGHLQSGYPGAPGSIDGEVPPSWEFELSSPTIHAKFDEETGAVFARGDYLYSWWYGRGSPGKTGTGSTGHMKWYIFGPNFKYADFNPAFPLADDGSYGITFPRSFTYGLSPGEYFIVYQHPGSNGQFDLLPENTLYFRGNMKQLINTADGRLVANVGALEGKSAADAVVRALDSSSVDDLYVMDSFTIEDPAIKIEPAGYPVVGDELVVRGTTNLAGRGTTADKTDVADTLTVTITALDLYDSGKANTVMKIPVDYTVPGARSPALGTRPFSYDPIDTSSWYPGMYQIAVVCKDVDFRSTSTFELLDEGSRRSASVNDPGRNLLPSANPDPTLTPAVRAEPALPKSAEATGFEWHIAIAAIFGVLFTRRR